jgi:hypothetical protein
LNHIHFINDVDREEIERNKPANSKKKAVSYIYSTSSKQHQRLGSSRYLIL